MGVLLQAYFKLPPNMPCLRPRTASKKIGGGGIIRRSRHALSASRVSLRSGSLACSKQHPARVTRHLTLENLKPAISITYRSTRYLINDTLLDNFAHLPTSYLKIVS